MHLCPSLIGVNCQVNTLVLTAGIAVRVKPPVQQRLNYLHEGVMHHTIPKRRGTDQSWLAFIDGKVSIRSWTISTIDKFTLQPNQFAFKIFDECRYFPPGKFSFSRI